MLAQASMGARRKEQGYKMGSMELLGHHQDQRVGVFVDTQNLYHSARDYYERNVNFESLLRFAVGGRRLVRATAYVVEKEGDTSAWPFIYKLPPSATGCGACT